METMSYIIIQYSLKTHRNIGINQRYQGKKVFFSYFYIYDLLQKIIYHMLKDNVKWKIIQFILIHHLPADFRTYW